MADYIKRTDVMTICESYSQHCFETSDSRGQDIADRIFDDVVEMNIADVAEVKHEKWREGALLKVGKEIKYYPTVICSDCGITFCDIINNHSYMYRYCPNCGAKMDGESEGGQ